VFVTLLSPALFWTLLFPAGLLGCRCGVLTMAADNRSRIGIIFSIHFLLAVTGLLWFFGFPNSLFGQIPVPIHGDFTAVDFGSYVKVGVHKGIDERSVIPSIELVLVVDATYDGKIPNRHWRDSSCGWKHVSKGLAHVWENHISDTCSQDRPHSCSTNVILFFVDDSPTRFTFGDEYQLCRRFGILRRIAPEIFGGCSVESRNCRFISINDEWGDLQTPIRKIESNPRPLLGVESVGTNFIGPFCSNTLFSSFASVPSDSGKGENIDPKFQPIRYFSSFFSGFFLMGYGLWYLRFRCENWKGFFWSMLSIGVGIYFFGSGIDGLNL
jgi:hypothetical protein